MIPYFCQTKYETMNCLNFQHSIEKLYIVTSTYLPISEHKVRRQMLILFDTV